MFVCERMAKKLITVQPDTKLSDVSQLMTQHNIRHLPVVNGEGLLVGIVFRPRHAFGVAVIAARQGGV